MGGCGESGPPPAGNVDESRRIMSGQPTSRLMTLYRWALGLAPVEHRRTYADEQMRLFEEVWRSERPAGWIGRSLFFADLFL